MKKKFLIFMSLTIIMCCFLAVSICAASSDEFGQVETIDSIVLTGMNADGDSRVVIVDANGQYHTYPVNYVVSANTRFSYDFGPINEALGSSYTKHSVIRIEVPDNITVATNCGDLSQTDNLVEIVFSENSQLTTLEYGCFFSNKKLKKVNIPKNVTEIGTLIINKNYCLEELIFDDGFSADIPASSFVGATGLKRVIFSNQIKNVANQAFDGTLGEELEELRFGTGLVNWGHECMSWIKQPVRIYAHSNFLANEETINMNTFSWWNGNCLEDGVLFFTGTKEQMQELINKSTYNKFISSNAKLVEWDSSIEDIDYLPSKGEGWTIVYNYNVCKAFYGDSHALTGEEKVIGDNYFETMTVGDQCTREGCGLVKTVKEIGPLFKSLGYSYSTFKDKNGCYSVTQGYKVNKEQIDKYKAYAPSFSYGVIATVNKTDLAVSPSLDGEKVISTPMENAKYDYIEVKICGLTSEHINYRLVLCAYVTVEDEILYLDSGKTCTSLLGISFEEVSNGNYQK